ncbi:MAG: ABC transporter ATP-binding protein [Planctomycetaceae bacterium]
MIRVENLSVRAGSFELHGVGFEIPTGQYAALMGRTGCGKTTLLEAICGLKTVTGGRILLDDRDVTHLKPGQRDVGFVPQDGALFTTQTIREQLGFALRIRKWPKNRIARRVEALAEILGISDLLDRYPKGLSGGERQRVALGRALSFFPKVLCVDEPLSALDEKTREEMYVLLKSLRDRLPVTTLHITHSREEARRLADVVFQLEDGRVRRMSAPSEGRRDARNSTNGGASHADDGVEAERLAEQVARED